ncbi:MAG: uridine kinase [Thermoanaerobaculia bacterium]
MIGDHLLIEDKHRRIARELVAKLPDDPGSTGDRLVVAIGGESGSGKSEVAHELARALKSEGRPAKILHLDNYYRTSPTEREPWRRRHGMESIGDQEIDWPELERHVAAFRAGGEATLPFIDLHNDSVDRLTTSFRDVRVLIIEGLYALRSPADLRILIELTYRDTKAAQLARGKETMDEFRWSVLEREHQVVSTHRALADLRIDREYRLLGGEH